MNHSAPNINRFWADLIIEELVRNGVCRYFVAPGSRSSPLVAALAQHPATEATIHFDERGAAFAALGYGRASQQPAAWITTSGTAAANGLPAIVEAAQSRVPLIALTADRPPELRDAGANQAIDQIRLFGSYARWFFDFPCPAPEIDPTFVLTAVDQAVHRAKDAPAGAVHLNCPFREPLAPSRDGVNLPAIPDRWLNSQNPYTEYQAAAATPETAHLSDLLRELGQARRGLIVVGELSTLEDARAVAALASWIGWPVVTDVTSQMRLGDAPTNVVSSPHFACATMAGHTHPDLVLRLGGPLSSIDIQRYLDTSEAPIIAVHDHPERRDPGHSVAKVIRASTGAFCETAAGIDASADADWLGMWTRAGRSVFSAVQTRIASIADVSEPGVAVTVTRRLPEGHALFVASSMPIRDVDMFGSSEGALRRVAANRGASGIDGTVASAFGFHLGAECPVTLLIGDLALLHDLNSLALLSGYPVVVVVINNRGGGIFNFLPIAEHPELFEPWFTAPHSWSFEQAAGMFDIPYEKARNAHEFEATYTRAVQSEQSTLIEIATERLANRDLHTELRALAAEACKSAVV